MLDESTTTPSVSGEAARKKAHAHEIAVALRNGLKLGASLLLTWSVALIVKLQIPRHLEPVYQGHFAFAESFAGMFFTLIGFGVDTYVVKEISVRQDHASDFIGGVFALRAIASLLLLAVMGTTLWVTGRGMDVQLTVLVFGVTQILMCTNGTLATVLQATTHVGRLAVANVLAKVFWGVGLLLGLHYGAPLWVLALPMLVSEAVRTAFLVPAASISAKLRYRIDRHAVRAVLVASLPYFVGAIAITFGSQLAMSALEFIRTDEREVGWFSAAQNIGSLAMLMHPLLVWVVMPMLSRTRARSEAEMMSVLRRAIQALIIVVTPAITLISAGSELFLRLLKDKGEYVPAALGLSILSLVFLMFYLSILMGNALVISGKSWSVTLISLSAVVLMALFMLIFVPLGRRLFHTGGECAGAAIAVVANEAYVVLAMLSRFNTSPFDRRNIGVLLRSGAVAAVVLLANHVLLRYGFLRLLADAALYLLLALSVRLVRLQDIRRLIGVLRTRGSPPDSVASTV
jgi:O-antigen/teichoic acid export membrane protein